MESEISHLVVALLTAGMGGIFLWVDRGSDASRALGVCLLAITASLFLGIGERVGLGLPSWLMTGFSVSAEAVAIIAGVEWGRRLGRTADSRLATVAGILFRLAQLLVLIFWGLFMGYIALAPESAGLRVDGVVRVRAIEFAIFAPVLGAAILFAGIAILLLRFSRIDRAEFVRLRALVWAGPFLLLALIINDALVPVTLSIGLLIFLFGSVRYLVIQGQRGQFMSQFLSPEVARMVRAQGMAALLQRERRPLTAVVCDLRGFTDYARVHDSDRVVDLLEAFYARVGEVAARHGGAVKDHSGDGMLVLVGAPVARGDHARRALALASEISVQGRELLAETAPELGLGVGVATGRVTVGAIQGAGRLEYVAVGTAVNLASRLCGMALDGEVLCDQRIADVALETGLGVESRGELELKGFPQPMAVHALQSPASAQGGSGAGIRAPS
jgi:adenylate cyclase